MFRFFRTFSIASLIAFVAVAALTAIFYPQIVLNNLLEIANGNNLEPVIENMIVAQRSYAIGLILTLIIFYGVVFFMVRRADKIIQAQQARLKQTEEAVRGQSFLQQVIDLNPHYIFAKDREGRFTLANKAFASAYCTTVEALIGKTDADFNTNQEMVERYDRDDLAVIETGQELRIPEDKIINIKGQELWRQTIKRPIVDENGVPYQVLGVASDITALKEAEKVLALAHKQSVEVDRLKNQLLANFRHDMRTPLGAILGYAEMLEQDIYGPLSHEQHDVITKIINSAEQLLEFINDLKELGTN